MPKVALLVIDMLNDFFERHANLTEQRPGLVTSINELVRAFRSNGHPIIWVRQEFAPDLSDAFLDMRKENIQLTIAGTKGCQLLPELNCDTADTVIVKKRYSAFFGTDLDERLAALRPDLLVFAGINTHACIRTAVIDAFQRDYEVVMATDCITSYDIEHHEITMRYLEKSIARPLRNDEILDMLTTDTI